MSAPVTVAYGDGIGPQAVEAALVILREAGADLEIETIEIGKRIYAMGSTTGILPSSWQSLARTRVLLKGPVTIPEKEGYEDTNLVIRRKMQLDGEPIPDATNLAQSWITEEFALFEMKDETLSGMLHAAVMMLEHVGQPQAASRIRAAWQAAVDHDKLDKTKKAEKFTGKILARLQQGFSGTADIAVVA